MDIMENNSPVLQPNIDARIPCNGAYASFLQSKFIRRYTGVIALHEVLHSDSWVVGIATIFSKRVKTVGCGCTSVGGGVDLESISN